MMEEPIEHLANPAAIMPTMTMPAILAAPTVTMLPPEARGAVVVTGSHGGAYVGRVAARAGVRALLAHDAGIGRDDAGIGALALLEALGTAAAAASHTSCRIGDTDDMIMRGRISRLNALARACGVIEGMAVQDAALLMRAAACVGAAVLMEAEAEAREVRRFPDAARALVLCDSASLVEKGTDDDAVVVTGSHGGLVRMQGVVPLKARCFAAVYNDAGIGIDDAGIGRLAALQELGIAALTVSAASARIGEARSTFEDGVISAANDVAHRRGARVGEPARAILLQWTRS